MKVELNITAPAFKLKDVFGRVIDLQEYKGRKVMIGFFRHVGCPFCNLRVHMLTRAHEDLKTQGLEMIFFFESGEEIILRSIFHQQVHPIPIISDSQKVWYNTYGLESSAYKVTMSHLTSFLQTAIEARRKSLPIHPMADGESFNTLPAEFLLDQNLIIRRLHYSERLNDRLSLEDIYAFAKS
ncbi:MAG: redoxin domain-containing protein [Bacteroidia bacterium]|nr:redoxin domain-containing protein [Bacteroidia bacterium]